MYKNLLSRFRPETSDNHNNLNELHKIPTKETRFEMPKFQDFKPNFTHQIDTLYLPTAKGGYKYLLVCVDDHTRHFDAEPMKNRSSTDALKAIKKIYERMTMPKVIEVDAGSEFKGQFKRYFVDHNVLIRVAEINRHRQQGLVEARNGVIGKVIFMLLDSTEMKTGKTSKDWYGNGKRFRELIEAMNEHIKFKPLTESSFQNIRVNDSNRDLLFKGEEVRVALDYPVSVAENKRLGSKFRTTDIRWSKDFKPVSKIILMPDQPPMYKVSDMNNLFTRQQIFAPKVPRVKFLPHSIWAV